MRKLQLICPCILLVTAFFGYRLGGFSNPDDASLVIAFTDRPSAAKD